LRSLFYAKSSKAKSRLKYLVSLSEHWSDTAATSATSIASITFTASTAFVTSTEKVNLQLVLQFYQAELAALRSGFH
jgi:hypothetical protein